MTDQKGQINPVKSAEEAGQETLPCTLGQFLAYFLRLGTFRFGGDWRMHQLLSQCCRDC